MTITVKCPNANCSQFGIEKVADIPDQTSPVFCSCGTQLNPAAATPGS